MKTKCLWLLLPFFLCGCSNSGVSSISSKEDFVVPAFKISITDSQGGYQFNTDDLGKELNLNSRYALKLIADKDTHPLFNECSFKFDKESLDIIDCINKKQDGSQFVWQLKPLKVVDKTSIEVYYHEELCSSIDLSIKDLSVNASLCASVDKRLDSVSDFFPGEITVFNDLTTYEDYLKTHNYFGYIKNSPTSETFNNYEYALIRIANYDLGKDPELNSVYLQNDTLYYDFISTKEYFEEPPSVTMSTDQDYYLALIRYPSGLNVSKRAISLSYEYAK